MKTNIIHNVVYEFENFLSKSEQKTLLKIVSDNNLNWNSGSNEYWQNKCVSVDSNILDSVNLRVKSIFNNYTNINGICSINRFLPGHEMSEHIDESGHEEIQQGVVIYINDNFKGGEICYPTLNYIYKPKARSLIVHPGNLPHYVNKVEEGPTRYFMTTFVHGIKENPVLVKYVNS